MRFSHLGIMAVCAAVVMVTPAALAESVGDQADMLEIDAMDLEKAGNFDGAVAKHREAIKLIEPVAKYAKKTQMFKENMANTLLGAANAKFNAKDNAAALACLEEALALDPNGKFPVTKKVKVSLSALKGNTLNTEAVGLIKTGDYAGAAAKLKEVLALDPDNKAARANLDVAESQIALAAGDPATAVAKLQDAVNIEPSSQFFKDLLTKAQEAAGAKAAEEAHKAAEKK